jgi:ribose-phosphate pyrophosphokinase
VDLAAAGIERFPDGELHIEVRESVRGHDVFLLQPTSPPFEAHFFELVLLADACRRAGAGRLTAVIPYFGYARQDRRARGREPVGARVVADLLAAAGFARVVAVDLHSAALEGMFPVPLEHVSAVPALADGLRGAPATGVVVAPDLGAVHLADRFARRLGLPVAVVHKIRLSGTEVAVRAVTGEVRGRTPIIVDDMISTGGTIVAAHSALGEAGCLTKEITVATTHGLLVANAAERLAGLGLGRLMVTDSVLQPERPVPPTQVVGLAPLLSDAIRRLHEGHSLADLLVHD